MTGAVTGPTCSTHAHACVERHFFPWQTHASQKSQTAPTMAIPWRKEMAALVFMERIIEM